MNILRPCKVVWEKKSAWLSRALCSCAALSGNSAAAHIAIDPKPGIAAANKSLVSANTGFSTGSCDDLAGTMGRLNDFDLAKIGQSIEPVSFGMAQCAMPAAQQKNDSPQAALSNNQDPAKGEPALSGKAKPIHAYPTTKSVFEGNYALLGVSVASIPSYEGSRHNRILPVPGAMGRWHGVEFRIAGPLLTLNFIPPKPGAKLGLSFGPSLRYRINRTSKTGDDLVDKLGKLDGVVEAGVSSGVTVNRLFNRHDMLSVGVSARWDISGKGSGMLVSPSATYITPVSKAQVIGALISADVVDQRFAQYNYAISPTGAAASGLPIYSARGGVKAFSFGAFTARDLNGKITDGGLSVGAGALYTKLCGSAAETPITKLRGKRNQWIFGTALAYAF